MVGPGLDQVVKDPLSAVEGSPVPAQLSMRVLDDVRYSRSARARQFLVLISRMVLPGVPCPDSSAGSTPLSATDSLYHVRLCCYQALRRSRWLWSRYAIPYAVRGTEMAYDGTRAVVRWRMVGIVRDCDSVWRDSYGGPFTVCLMPVMVIKNLLPCPIRFRSPAIPLPASYPPPAIPVPASSLPCYAMSGTDTAGWYCCAASCWKCMRLRPRYPMSGTEVSCVVPGGAPMQSYCADSAEVPCLFAPYALPTPCPEVAIHDFALEKKVHVGFSLGSLQVQTAIFVPASHAMSVRSIAVLPYQRRMQCPVRAWHYLPTSVLRMSGTSIALPSPMRCPVGACSPRIACEPILA
eukprot:1362112-Rhodomonas_salina.2